jgi:hypothetical protein
VLAASIFSSDEVMQAPGGSEEDPTGGFRHGGWSVNYFDEEMMERPASQGGCPVSVAFQLLICLPFGPRRISGASGRRIAMIFSRMRDDTFDRAVPNRSEPDVRRVW